MRRKRNLGFWVLVGFLLFILLQFLFLRSLSWIVVPSLEQPVDLFQIVMIRLDCFIALGMGLYIVKSTRSASAKHILLLLITLTIVGVWLVVFPLKLLILMTINLPLFTCSRHWEQVDFPQYQKTIYFKPQDCWDGVNTGYKAYASKNWHPLMQPLLTSEYGWLEASDLEVNEEMITLSAWQEG